MFNQNPSASDQQTPYDHHDPDVILIRAMAEGNIQALDELYARYGPMLLGYLHARVGNRQLAEEILQDVMLAAWEHAARFEARSKVKTWLLVIARNRAINSGRKKRVPVIQLNDVFNLKSDDTGPMEAAVRSEKQALVRDAINQLPEGQREVLVLTFYHQLTGPEIAEVLDISEGTVKSRLHRARTTLKRLLGSEELL